MAFNSIHKELADFNDLPKQLRDILNYGDYNFDPRYILGMYKTLGIEHTLNYLEDIGVRINGY